MTQKASRTVDLNKKSELRNLNELGCVNVWIELRISQIELCEYKKESKQK